MKTGKRISDTITVTTTDGEREWYFVLKQHVENRIAEKLIGTEEYMYTCNLWIEIKLILRTTIINQA